MREKGHVYIEILTAAVSEQVRPILSRAVVGLVILICVIITYYGIEVTIRAFVRDEMDMRSLDMPRWMLMISMPICFGLMSLQFLRFVIGPETLHSGEAGMHE